MTENHPIMGIIWQFGKSAKLYPRKNESDKEKVKFRNFAKEFAGFFGVGGKEMVNKLVKFL